MITGGRIHIQIETNVESVGGPDLDLAESELEKTRVFLKKTQPSGFFWVFLGFLGFFGFFGVFLGFFAQTRGFLGFFQFHEYF